MNEPHARWCELADAQAQGESLDDDALAFLQEHADDPAGIDERSFYDELAQLAEPEPVRDDDRRRAALTLARFRAEAARRRVRRVATVVVALAAAVVMAWALATAWSSARDVARVDRGGFELAGDALVIGDAVPDGQWLRATATTCVAMSAARVCVEPGSELRLEGGRVQLRRGALQVEHGAIEVATDDDVRALGEGERLAIEDTATVAVTHEVAPLAEAAPLADVVPAPDTSAPVVDDAPVLDAGSGVATAEVEPRRGARAPAITPATAGEMLAAARALANAKQSDRAVAAYEALRRAHPDSAEAHAANVSIGELQLRRRRFAAAFAAFGRYLARGGALAEEARWGRVRALQGLGRTTARDAAIDDLLASHPGTIYADEARAMRTL